METHEQQTHEKMLNLIHPQVNIHILGGFGEESNCQEQERKHGLGAKTSHRHELDSVKDKPQITKSS